MMNSHINSFVKAATIVILSGQDCLDYWREIQEEPHESKLDPPKTALYRVARMMTFKWSGPRGVAGYTEALACARHVCQLPSRILKSLQHRVAAYDSVGNSSLAVPTSENLQRAIAQLVRK
jgi:hypothetical protein